MQRKVPYSKGSLPKRSRDMSSLRKTLTDKNEEQLSSLFGGYVLHKSQTANTKIGILGPN